MSESVLCKVLGIDVGTATTGWAVLEKDNDSKNKVRLIDYGVISTSPKDPMPQRLNHIFETMGELIKKYSPDSTAVESLFYFKNQKTVMTVSQARGVILLAAQRFGLEIFEYTPLQVKSAVTGYGRADKKQVQKMVRLILGLEAEVRPDDAADAVAIAICHLSSVNLMNKAS